MAEDLLAAPERAPRRGLAVALAGDPYRATIEEGAQTRRRLARAGCNPSSQPVRSSGTDEMSKSA
jgi:hypothetical protein